MTPSYRFNGESIERHSEIGWTYLDRIVAGRLLASFQSDATKGDYFAKRAKQLARDLAQAITAYDAAQTPDIAAALWTAQQEKAA